MQLVIADTGPINYLVLIGHIDILPALFEKVILPSIVRDELTAAPLLIRRLVTDPPSWVEVRKTTTPCQDASLASLDKGEEEAIALQGFREPSIQLDSCRPLVLQEAPQAPEPSPEAHRPVSRWSSIYMLVLAGSIVRSIQGVEAHRAWLLRRDPGRL